MKFYSNLLILFMLPITTAFAQEHEQSKPYNIDADASKQISDAVAKAKAENKHVLLMIGGNWCKWCLIFNRWATSEAQVDSAIKADYVMVHLNFSKENRNLPVMEKLDHPQRFGFPVFVVLNQKGERIHTQNSEYLEKGEGYSKEKVLEFLKQWRPAALNADQYK